MVNRHWNIRGIRQPKVHEGETSREYYERLYNMNKTTIKKFFEKQNEITRSKPEGYIESDIVTPEEYKKVFINRALGAEEYYSEGKGKRDYDMSDVTRLTFNRMLDKDTRDYMADVNKITHSKQYKDMIKRMRQDPTGKGKVKFDFNNARRVDNQHINNVAGNYTRYEVTNEYGTFYFLVAQSPHDDASDIYVYDEQEWETMGKYNYEQTSQTMKHRSLKDYGF